MEEIRSTVETSQPLIGPSVSVERLLSYYQDNDLPGFLDGIRYLSSKYPRMRSVRGDGNCFYRSRTSYFITHTKISIFFLDLFSSPILKKLSLVWDVLSLCVWQLGMNIRDFMTQSWRAKKSSLSLDTMNSPLNSFLMSVLPFESLDFDAVSHRVTRQSSFEFPSTSLWSLCQRWICWCVYLVYETSHCWSPSHLRKLSPSATQGTWRNTLIDISLLWTWASIITQRWMVAIFPFLSITLLFSVLSERSWADGEGMRTLAGLCFDGISPDPREDRVSRWKVVACIGSIDLLISGLEMKELIPSEVFSSPLWRLQMSHPTLQLRPFSCTDLVITISSISHRRKSSERNLN